MSEIEPAFFFAAVHEFALLLRHRIVADHYNGDNENRRSQFFFDAFATCAASPIKRVPSEQANPWSWLIIAVIGIAAIWLIVGVLRSVMWGRASAPGTAMSPDFGGGGMFGSLLGGMIGEAGGMWLCDQLCTGTFKIVTIAGLLKFLKTQRNQ